MTDTSIVRMAEPADRDQIRVLLQISHDEDSVFPLNRDKARAMEDMILDRSQVGPEHPEFPGCIAVIGPLGGPLEAVVVLVVNTQWWTDEKQITQLTMLVHPDYRATDHAATLIDWMIELSQRTGLKLTAGVLHWDRADVKSRMFRNKMKFMGEYFMYDPRRPGNDW